MTNKWFLKRVQIFSELSDHDLEIFLEIVTEKTYKENEIIFHENDQGSALFILKLGAVKISICDKNGKEDILKLMYPFDFFGEMSLLDGQHRSATVTALEKTTTIIIQRDQFINLIIKHPEIALNMLAMLSRRIRKTDEKIGVLRFANAYGKMAKVLLDISEEKGVKRKNNIEISLKLTRQELADFAGITRETGTRILNEFQKCGCLKLEKNKIIILNEAILRRELV
ncbi:MAG: Crp/Fnr family transcriptional regulator [Candidatus Firestonebacteria bacterium]|nr:Crp/Fnr family transcriptional regulator [Candidatus Firestonebacteria bacterium]